MLRLPARTALALIVLAVAGCGGSDESAEDRGQEAYDKVVAAVNGLQGEARERKLKSLADAEGGEVSIYTSLTADSETAVAEAFEDATDLDVSVYRATSEIVAQRVSEESEAGFPGADVVETGGTEMATLSRDGVFSPYDPPAGATLVEGSRKDGWIADRYNRFVVTWNTDRVPPSQRPRSFDDLADPRWRGKIVLEESDSDWYKTLREYLVGEGGKSPADADRLLEGIAANARAVNSHSLQTQLLGSGEFAIGPSVYLHQARDAVDKDAPLAFEPRVPPVISRPQGVGVLKTAKHPAAALLYVDWLLSDGQEVLKEHNVDPARKDLAGRQGDEVSVDVDAFVADDEEWDDRYENLLRRSGRVEGGG
jgi:iron(III) transport system substrate-binding protein